MTIDTYNRKSLSLRKRITSSEICLIQQQHNDEHGDDKRHCVALPSSCIKTTMKMKMRHNFLFTVFCVVVKRLRRKIINRHISQTITHFSATLQHTYLDRLACFRLYYLLWRHINRKEDIFFAGSKLSLRLKCCLISASLALSISAVQQMFVHVRTLAQTQKPLRLNMLLFNAI